MRPCHPGHPGAGACSRDERVSQLLDVAQHLFAETGYAGTSIELIARTAGVSRPVVYEHFGSKDGIYFACVRRARARFHDAVLAGVVGTEDLEARLYAGLDACFAFIEEDPDRWAVMFRGVVASRARPPRWPCSCGSRPWRCSPR